MRFRLIQLIWFTSGVGAFITIAQSAGYYVAAGVSLALALVAWSLMSRRRRVYIAIRLAVGCVGLIAMWFLAVDWSWFQESCPDCYWGRDIDQYRLLGCPIYTRCHERPTIVQLALADLGKPCVHEKKERWQKHRRWGLLVCACPCWNGTSGLTAADDRYTDKLSARIRKQGRSDPALAAELHRHVVEQHDYECFWQAFMIDELAPQWTRATTTREALSWLRGGSKTDVRFVSVDRTTEESVAMVQEAYDAGAVEILALDVQQNSNYIYDEPSGLLLKLPSEPMRRMKLLAWIDQFEPDHNAPRRDYGQSYAHFFP